MQVNIWKNIYLNCEERCNSSWETNEKIKFGLERDSNPWPLRYRKIGISLLQSPTKVLAHLPAFNLQHLSRKFVSSSPSPDSMLLIVISFPTLSRGEGVPYSSDVITPKYACQRIFVLSDSGVPRTFVVDCSSVCSESEAALVGL